MSASNPLDIEDHVRRKYRALTEEKRDAMQRMVRENYEDNLARAIARLEGDDPAEMAEALLTLMICSGKDYGVSPMTWQDWFLAEGDVPPPREDGGGLSLPEAGDPLLDFEAPGFEKEGYLLGDCGAPKRIHQDRDFTIGRDPSCSCPLNSGKVSRLHAVIRWDGAHFVLKDQNSRNGTKVNGKEMKSARLTHGDLISIGFFDLRFVHDNRFGVEKAAKDQEDTDTMAIPPIRHSTDLAGTIGSLEEILQFLESAKKSGVLTVVDAKEQRTGKLHYQDGFIIAADFHGHADEAAVRHMLCIQEGGFSFEKGEQKFRGDCSLSAARLIGFHNHRRKIFEARKAQESRRMQKRRLGG